MSDGNNEFEPPAPVRFWIEPLDVRVGDAHGACGPDLEYDPDMQELEKAAAGKPETQFSAAEPPQWNDVRERAEALMQRTRDLRVAMLWCRAAVNVEGFAALPAALCLLQGMVDKLWDGLYPLPDPDDGDAFARVSVLGGLDKLDSLLGDVRQSLLVQDRRLPSLRVRTVEIALDKLAPRAGEETMSIAQMHNAFTEMPEVGQALRESTAQAQHWMKRLVAVTNERFGIGTIELKNLRTMITAVESAVPAVEAAGDGEESLVVGDDGTPAPATRRSGGGVHSIDSRADAIRAIEMICAYLERNEPTNPAQLLLRRAARLIDKNFLQLVRDFAPGALDDVARILGVSTDDIDSG